MTKRMRELQAQILELTNEAKGYMEGENKDLEKAEGCLNKAEELQKELDLLGKIENAKKANAADVATEVEGTKKADGFELIVKMMNGKATEAEKAALVTGTDSANGENYLIPEDVKTEINELRKSYVSAKELVTVEPTASLTGSVNYEKGAPAGLVDFDDGDAIAEESSIQFDKIPFTIGFKGKLIPVSRILAKGERAGLMSYLDKWFVKNAIISENADIFATLKAGYNGGTPKAIAGWKALKRSINVDLDPACKINGVIATNQSGFAMLDEEEDANGRPILQPNPANPTEKLFQGLVVKVYPDAQLPNIDATHFPVIYGDTKAGATFKEFESLEFNVSEHFLFNKNQNCLRAIEGYDVMSTDKGAYIYGSLTATVKA